MNPNLALTIQKRFVLEFQIPLTINQVEQFKKIENLEAAGEPICEIYAARYENDILLVYVENDELINMKKISVNN